MHYLYPFFSSDRQGKTFVTLASILMIIIGVLFIAYVSRNIVLFHKQDDYGVAIIKDPLVGYYMFFGIQAFFVFLYNIIQNMRQYHSAEESEPKWWATYWLMFIQSMFTMAAAVGACGSRNTYAPYKYYIDVYQSTPGNNPVVADYLEDWATLYRYLLALIIITFVLGIPTMIFLVYGLAQKLRAYRIDAVKEGMHRNPQLDMAANKPSVTKL